MREAVVTVRQIQHLDQIAIEEIGIPSVVLMENAGRAVAGEAIRYLKGKKKTSACVFCGLGNNAGDGFVAARHLVENRINASVYLIGRSGDLKHDAAVNYAILRKLKCPIKEIRSANKTVLKNLSQAGLVVDAIFGVGLSREISGPSRDIIEALNESDKKILSVDVPSGLDASTGNIRGVCIKAFQTVTFTLAKKGFFLNAGPVHVGRLVIADIGIPKDLFKRIGVRCKKSPA